MKVTVVALVTWTAASMATATPVPMDAAHSALNTTTLTATHTPISGLSANIKTSHPVDTTEERAPQEVADMLAKVHASIVSAEVHPANTDELLNRVHGTYTKFTPLIGTTNSENIFDTPYFLQWTEFVRLSYKYFPGAADKTILGILAFHFGTDDALFEALVARSNSNTANRVVDELLNAQLQEWANDRKDVAEVFELLGLHETGGKITESPLFLKWNEFVKSRYPDKTEAFVAMFPVLAKYLEGEDLTRLERRLDSKLEGGAEDLKHAAKIFKLLRLHLAHGNIIASNLFSTWFAFSTARYSDMSEAFVAIFPFLADHLKGDDLNQLNRALNKHLYLLANREKDATEVFKLLGLHLTNGKCFESPLYSKWIAFVRLRYHDKTEAFVAMFPALADHLMGSDLAELKGELKSQLNVWATKDGQDVAEIFKLLKLHLTDGKVVESPLYTEWFEFVREKYGDDTKAFVAMFPVLADHLKDDELAKLLVVGLTLDLTKESAAKRLNERAEELVKEWVDNSKDAAYVFELLELHLRKNYNILLQESLEERPLVTLWEKFVQEKSVEKEKVVLMLNRFYNKANGLPKVHVAGMQMNNAKIDESRMIQLSTKADFLKDPSTPKFYNWL